MVRRIRSSISMVLLLPTLLTLLAATALIGWRHQAERTRVAEITAPAAAADLVLDVNGMVVSETTQLMAVGAFPERAPELAQWRAGARTTREVVSRPVLVQLLRQTDSRGPGMLEELVDSGLPVSDEIRAVLAPLSREQLAQAAAGERVSGLRPADYADAIADLQAEMSQRTQRTRDVVTTLTERSQDDAWDDTGLISLLAGLWALALAVALLVRRRIVTLVEARDGLAARNARLLALVDAGRRMSNPTAPDEVAATVACEVAGIVGADVAAVVSSADGRPAAVHGDPALADLAAGGIACRRAIEGATAEREVVAGSAGPLAVIAAPLVSDGRVLGALVTARRTAVLPDAEDVTTVEMAARLSAPALVSADAVASADRAANTDALTGLANRRRLDADLGAVVSEGAARGARTGLVMIDVDHFKAYNDRHGHPAGDVLLRRVGRLIAASVRAGDVVYRYGGEEFAVLLPDAGADEAQAVAERIREAVASADLPGGETQPGGRVTVSVGVAGTFDADGDALVAAADGALYAAKRNGRDRVEVAAGAVA